MHRRDSVVVGRGLKELNGGVRLGIVDSSHQIHRIVANEVQALNLTRERVRQIKERALRRLREEANVSILLKYLG
mgnify:CR=1 FL=1